MRCRTVKKQLALFVGGDLPEHKSRKLLDHLEHCRDCAAELEVLKRSQALVREIAETDIPEPLPPDFSWAIHRRIVKERARESSTGKRLGILRWQPALIFCGITLILLLILGLPQRIWREEEKPIPERQIVQEVLPDADLDGKYPTVESITLPENETLMTMKLKDTNITVVWLF